MSEYGLLTTGDDILEQSMIPSTIERDGPDPLGAPLEFFEIGMVKLKSRLRDALQFVALAAASNGPCRCAYAPDPNCLVCKAHRLMEQFKMEDSPHESMEMEPDESRPQERF